MRERRSLYPKRAEGLSEATESQKSLSQTYSYAVQALFPLLTVKK
jgi:hypothetical protein